MPTVSVLMCVFNTNLTHLKESIDSITNQTFINWQFIIVDDGNKSVELKAYLKNKAHSDSRIKLIVNKTNLGLTKSLNIGLKYCTGKYVARMDSDDISLPDRLFKQFCYMESHPDIDILGCNVKQFGDNDIHVAKFRNYVSGDLERFNIKMLFNNVGPIHPTVMIKKSFLDNYQIEYREDIKKAQDYALWLDCLKVGGHFACLTECLLYYRIHDGQISCATSEDQNRYKRLIIQENIMLKFGVDKHTAEVLSTLYSPIYEYSVYDYQKSLKEVRSANCCFSDVKLNEELRERWIHKIVKCVLYNCKLKGFFSIYTIRCFFSKSFLSWIKDHLIN